jgi:hypothetical protein
MCSYSSAGTHKWERGIKMDVKEVEFERRSVSGYDIFTGFCEHGNGSSLSFKEGNIYNQLSIKEAAVLRLEDLREAV